MILIPGPYFSISLLVQYEFPPAYTSDFTGTSQRKQKVGSARGDRIQHEPLPLDPPPPAACTLLSPVSDFFLMRSLKPLCAEKREHENQEYITHVDYRHPPLMLMMSKNKDISSSILQ